MWVEGVEKKWESVGKKFIDAEMLNWDSYLAQLGQIGLT